MIVDGRLRVQNRPRLELVRELRVTHRLKPIPPSASTAQKSRSDSSDSDDESDGDQAMIQEPGQENLRDFDYLLSMPLWNLTREKVFFSVFCFLVYH